MTPKNRAAQGLLALPGAAGGAAASLCTPPHCRSPVDMSQVQRVRQLALGACVEAGGAASASGAARHQAPALADSDSDEDLASSGVRGAAAARTSMDGLDTFRAFEPDSTDLVLRELDQELAGHRQRADAMQRVLEIVSKMDAELTEFCARPDDRPVSPSLSARRRCVRGRARARAARLQALYSRASDWQHGAGRAAAA